MIKIKRNVKKGERRKLEIKRSSKSKERALAVKFRSKSEPLRKSPPSRQNGFAASKHPLQKFSQLRRGPLAHECHFASPYTRFVAAKWLRSLHALKSSILQPRRHLEGCFTAVKPPFRTRVPFCSLVHSFQSCKMVAKSRWFKILQLTHHEQTCHSCIPIGHILITFWSLFHAYHISFQILGS